ncbi:MAG: hypothetical protein ACREF9_15405, partial [Opitutaceae bacterium]
ARAGCVLECDVGVELLPPARTPVAGAALRSGGLLIFEFSAASTAEPANSTDAKATIRFILSTGV